jgi:hypothetical protein
MPEHTNDQTPPAPIDTRKRWPWYRDRIWSGSDWIMNPTPGTGPGSQPVGDDIYTPEARTQVATRIWTTMFCTVALMGWSGVLFGEDLTARLAALLPALGLTGMALLALHTAVSNQTRRITWDTQGLCDQSYFGSQHIPWVAVASLKRVNTAAARQKSYNLAAGGVSRPTSATLRPRDVWVWQVNSVTDQILLDFTEPDRDENHPAFHALRERIEQHLDPAAHEFRARRRHKQRHQQSKDSTRKWGLRDR